MKLLISHLLFNPIKFGFYPLHSPPTIHINGPFRSITCDLLTSAPVTCFCSSSHFTSLKHFIMQTLPFPLTAQEPPMPGFAPVLLATCLQSLFQPLFTFLDSFQLCLSPFSLPVLMSGSQEDIRIIWEIF